MKIFCNNGGYLTENGVNTMIDTICDSIFFTSYDTMRRKLLTYLSEPCFNFVMKRVFKLNGISNYHHYKKNIMIELRDELYKSNDRETVFKLFVNDLLEALYADNKEVFKIFLSKVKNDFKDKLNK